MLKISSWPLRSMSSILSSISSLMQLCTSAVHILTCGASTFFGEMQLSRPIMLVSIQKMLKPLVSPQPATITKSIHIWSQAGSMTINISTPISTTKLTASISSISKSQQRQPQKWKKNSTSQETCSEFLSIIFAKSSLSLNSFFSLFLSIQIL